MTTFRSEGFLAAEPTGEFSDRLKRKDRSMAGTTKPFRRVLQVVVAFIGTAAVPVHGGMPPVLTSLGALLGDHPHEPIDLDARPIVSRYNATLLRPRRILLDPAGQLYVADWEAGAVLRIGTNGKTTLVADGLDEPAGLARDLSGNLYVAAHAGGMAGAGRVIRITPAGEQTVYAAGLTGPTALAFDPMGQLYVANFHENSIVRVDPNGNALTVAQGIPTPAALVFDGTGALYAVSSTDGTLLRINSMGEPTVVCRGLSTPSDLAIDPEGHLIVANYGGTELLYVSAKGEARTFAVVPKGTIGLEFDPAGNLLLVNWDLQCVMKVTTQLAVPCPHCGRDIPVRLRAKEPPPDRRQPPSPNGPVI